MTIAEYRAHPAINFSSLKHILTSPAHYMAALKREDKSTESMQIGTALHAAWLEGKPFDHVVKPADHDGRTKEGKEWVAANKGKLVLSTEDDAKLKRRLDALQSSKLASSLLAATDEREKPFIVDIEDGQQLKALFDGAGGWGFIDLKTTADNSPKAWGETVMRYHYDLQVALYSRVWKIAYMTDKKPTFYWITVSDDDSPVVAVYNLAPFGLGGEDKLDRALMALKKLRANGEEPISGEMPYWALREAVA
jgi:hypothetical protein